MSTKITGLTQEVIADMESKGKVETLSRKNAGKIDESLAKGLTPIQKEFRKKERASRAYAKTMEAKLLFS